MKLTKRFVDSVPFTESGTKIYRDDELRGFVLRVGKQTKKYTLDKRINGKLHREVVSDTNLITLTEARNKAMQMISNIQNGLDAYDDPNRSNSETDIEVPTLREAYKYFKDMKTLKPRTIDTYDSQILGYLEKWLDISLNDISKTMISDMHKKITRRSPAQANATMRTLRSVWNYCRHSFLDDDEEFIIKEQPIVILNAKKDWNYVPPRTRHVEEEYLAPYFKTLVDFKDRSSHRMMPYSNNARDLLFMFLFTGVRLNEAQTLAWKDIDMKVGRIVFKNTKNGSDYPMPMGQILNKIMEERYRLRQGEKWVFPTHIKRSDDHVKDLSDSYKKVANKVGLHITPHDLRRTFGTVANSINVNYPVLKKLLNHRDAKTSDDVTLQYIQVSQRQLREALNMIEQLYCKKADLSQETVISCLYD